MGALHGAPAATQAGWCSPLCAHRSGQGMEQDMALGGVVRRVHVQGASGVVITSLGLEDVPCMCLLWGVCTAEVKKTPAEMKAGNSGCQKPEPSRQTWVESSYLHELTGIPR